MLGGGVRTRTGLRPGDVKSVNSAEHPHRPQRPPNACKALRKPCVRVVAISEGSDQPRAEGVRRRVLGGRSADDNPKSDLGEGNDREHTESVAGKPAKDSAASTVAGVSLPAISAGTLACFLNTRLSDGPPRAAAGAIMSRGALMSIGARRTGNVCARQRLPCPGQGCFAHMYRAADPGPKAARGSPALRTRCATSCARTPPWPHASVGPPDTSEPGAQARHRSCHGRIRPRHHPSR